MDDTTRLKLILAGLFIAAAALIFFIFARARVDNHITRSPSPSIGTIIQASPSVMATPLPSNQLPPAANRAVQQNTSNLPSTGFPEVGAVLFSLAAIGTGWKLRKFSRN
jgi:hypothetical protein